MPFARLVQGSPPQRSATVIAEDRLCWVEVIKDTQITAGERERDPRVVSSNLADQSNMPMLQCIHAHIEQSGDVIHAALSAINEALHLVVRK